MEPASNSQWSANPPQRLSDRRPRKNGHRTHENRWQDRKSRVNWSGGVPRFGRGHRKIVGGVRPLHSEGLSVSCQSERNGTQ